MDGKWLILIVIRNIWFIDIIISVNIKIFKYCTVSKAVIVLNIANFGIWEDLCQKFHLTCKCKHSILEKNKNKMDIFDFSRNRRKKKLMNKKYT